MKKHNRRSFIKILTLLTGGSMINLKGFINAEHLLLKRNPILPPGAININNFNRHCSACHLCISKCPSKILTPAKLEYELKGIMQPIINYDEGYCEYNCIECMKVCPTGAITSPYINKQRQHNNNEEQLIIKEKQLLQIGIAKYNKELCLIKVSGINCNKCASNCPAGAINIVKGENNLSFPSVNVNKCIGCGVCEYYCPTLIEKKAIWIDGVKNQLRIANS